MFERFTDRARRVIAVSQEEAKALHHDLIGPEHLLLGLVQGDGVAATALAQLSVNLEQLRSNVEQAVHRSRTDNRGSKVPFSPKAKRALEQSLRQALRLGHNYIGTEHLLLGALEVIEDDGTVIQLLGVASDDIRARVAELMPKVSAPELPRSPAAAAALRLARQLAGSGPITTGHLLLAMLSDTASQASKALGVSAESLQPRLAAVPLNETSDSPPRPRIVEIRLGETTTRIGDPELAAALGELSPEHLRAALREVLRTNPAHPETGSEEAG